MERPVDPGMETPLAPLPDPAPEPTTRRSGRRPPGPWRVGLGAGLRYARGAWVVLLLMVALQLALALTVVLPLFSGLSARLDHHAHAAALAGSPDEADRALGWQAGMDPGIWRDLKREEASLFRGLTLTHFWIAVVAWLLGALAAGGFLGTAASGERPVPVGRFLALGGKHFGRMLRVGLVFAVSYYVLARGVFELWGASVQPDEAMAAAETSAWWGARVREAVFVLLFFWLRAAGDWARADLVVFGRTSAVGAFVRGLGRVVRLRVIGTALGVGLPAFALLLLLALATSALTGDRWGVLLALFLVFQVAVLVRWTSRAALLAAFAHLVAARATQQTLVES